jgi:hypothetical protein
MAGVFPIDVAPAPLLFCPKLGGVFKLRKPSIARFQKEPAVLKLEVTRKCQQKSTARAAIKINTAIRIGARSTESLKARRLLGGGGKREGCLANKPCALDHDRLRHCRGPADS